MSGHAAHILINGHLIIIENNDHGLTADGSIIQAFIDHTAGGGAITEKGHHVVILPQKRSGTRHAQSNGHGTGCMSGNKSIRVTFGRLRETGNTTKLTKMLKIRLAASQQLMDIRLMAYIKHQAVNIRIENGLNGNGQFHRTQIGSQMASCFRNMRYQKFADFFAQALSFFICQVDQIVVTVNVL